MPEETSAFIRDLAAATVGDRAAAERNAAWRAGAEHAAAEALRLISMAPGSVNEYVDPNSLREALKPFADGVPEDIYGDGYRRGMEEACKEFMLQLRVHGHRYKPAGVNFRSFCDVVLNDDE